MCTCALRIVTVCEYTTAPFSQCVPKNSRRCKETVERTVWREEREQERSGSVNMCSRALRKLLLSVIRRAPLSPTSYSWTRAGGKRLKEEKQVTHTNTQHEQQNTRQDKTNTTNNHTKNHRPALHNDRRWRGDGAYHLPHERDCEQNGVNATWTRTQRGCEYVLVCSSYM